jgi:glycosyltransferase involved in cell wall biosynthesis
MACGAPVVTTAKTVMAEIAGDTAILADAGDAATLAEALSRTLALSDEERTQRSALARARAQEFTWDNSMAKHLEAYDLAARGD